MSKSKQAALAKPEPGLTREEWLSELASIAIGTTNGDGLTTEEICERSGRNVRWARDAIRRAIRRGEWEYIGKRSGVGSDGRPIYQPVYRPVKGGRR